MLEFGKLEYLLQEAQSAFGTMILTPPQFFAATETSLHMWIQKGKRVLLLSRTDYGAAMSGSMFARDNLCGWSEPGVQQIDTVHCSVESNKTMQGRIFRPETSMLEYGPIPGVYDTYQLNTTTLPPIARCAINLPSPDSLVPVLYEARVWSFAPGQVLPPNGSSCAIMPQSSERWIVSLNSTYCNLLPSVAAPINGKANMALWQASSQPKPVRLIV